MQTSHFPILNLPIKYRLPLLMGVLLSGVILGSIWASYRSVREAALELGSERLRNLTQQLASFSQQSTATLLTRTLAAANEPSVIAFIRSPSSATQPAAAAVLLQFTPPQDPNSFQVELWNADRSLAMISPPGATPLSVNLEAEFKQCGEEPFKTVGVIRRINESVVYSVAAAAKDEAGKPIGYLVRWRRLSPTGNAQKQVADLLGSQAALFYGNAKGDVWTDLSRVVPTPPGGLQSTLEVSHYMRDGRSVMAQGRPIPGTPWFVVVEFPDQVFLSQATRFLRRMLVAGLALLLVGIAGAVLLSHNITAPLHSLTQATTAISAGDYSRTVEVQRNDELGELATAFNVMVARVRHSQLELEKKIEESKQAEEAASKLAAIVTSSEDAIIGKTLDGIITSWNAGATKLFGYTESEMVGAPSPLIPGDRLHEEDQILEHLRRGESPRPFDTVRRAKDGRLIEVSLRVSPIKNSANKVIGASTVMRDISDRRQMENELQATNQRLARDVTERRHLEDQLRQSQKLEAVGQLAGGVAHDFNNLLTVIGGYSDLVLRRLPDDSPLLANVAEIKKASDRASSLTRQLLAFSRKQILQPTVLNLNEVVSNLERMLQRLIGEDIDLLVINAPDLGQVKADAGQIDQVIINLIVNARDAMPGGGMITIQTANVVLSEEYSQSHIPCVPGKYVMLAVNDTGMGMDAETQSHIFEPFFTTKVAGKGTGLGLSTAYGIVKQSGGNIWVYSESGTGTTFKIYLPRVDEVFEADSEMDVAQPAPPGHETILLVEDEEQVREMSQQILIALGYEVLTATNGQEALSVAERYRGNIDLTITDVVMPQLSGRELIERLGPHRPEMKVLYMSGYTDDAIVRHGLLDERLEFLQKPFAADTLARKIRTILDAPRGAD